MGRLTTPAAVAVALATGLIGASHAPARGQPAQSRPAPPATTQPSFDPQRFNDLIALIEGQNPPQARRTGARELLRQAWPETGPRLTRILRGADRPAKIAVALALSDLPHCIITDYTEPLLALLSDPDAEVRRAGVAALASSPTDDALPQLKSLVRDTEQPLPTRLAAIDALGMMTQRQAVAILIEALADREAQIAGPALVAFERATALHFQGDTDAALAWWDEARRVSVAEWQRLQIQRLIRQGRSQEQRIQELEQRLASALRENYVRTAEAQRPTLLRAYLADVSAAVSQLGLALVQSKVAEGKALESETAALTRELLSAAEPGVRAAAVRTVATLRDPTDADRFQQLLASERHATVRAALINGLGYVGSTSAAGPLLTLLESADRTTFSEAVTSLGRLAERGVLDEATRAAVASALLSHLKTTSPDEHARRERLLWAMSRVGDPRFGVEFVAALNTPEAATVRLTAIRGIAVLSDPKTVRANGQASQPVSNAANQTPHADLMSPRELIDALVAVTNDPDAGVRRAAVETLAQFAVSDAHVEALWGRLSAEREPEEGIRVAAWRGALRVIASRPVGQIASWLERLPGDEATKQQQAIELLRAAERNRTANPEARGELGSIRARLAAYHARLNQIEQSISTYLTALEDLHAASSPELTPVAIELLRLALLHGRYDEQLAAALNQTNPVLDSQALWTSVRDEIEKRLRPEAVDQAIAMLAALQAQPPAPMSADTQAALQQMLQRARQVRTAADANAVKAALQTLREKPDDEQARQTVIALGARAAPTVRAALQVALQTEQPDASRIQLLHDLLKALDPKWPGFAPDAPLEQKLKTLQQAPA